jgi:polyphosphate kinase
VKETTVGKKKKRAATEMSASGHQPQDSKLRRKAYEAKLDELHMELVKMQYWIKAAGKRLVVLFEGRDAAGKGGVIKCVAEPLNPRGCRIVALAKPSDTETTQWYFQRYVAHLPAAGEIVLFDRSWYNRAGVEHVMGFCTNSQHQRFLKLCPVLENWIAESGVVLIKYWLEVSNEEQERRFKARIDDPLRQWKLSPVDLPSRSRWYDYSLARDMMLEATDTENVPWFILRSDDKKRARLNCISHLLSLIPYKNVPREKVDMPKRSNKGAYNDQATIQDRRFVPEKS